MQTEPEDSLGDRCDANHPDREQVVKQQQDYLPCWLKTALGSKGAMINAH